MPTPDFILELRRHVGHAELWLPGVTAVIRRSEELLLVRRSDTGSWTPVGGIVEPGEPPAACARREALEETGVEITVDRLALVAAGEPQSYPNGDQVRFLTHTFACTWVSGEAHPADEESSEVGWFGVDALPPLHAKYRERLDAALSAEVATRFEH